MHDLRYTVLLCLTMHASTRIEGGIVRRSSNQTEELVNPHIKVEIDVEIGPVE